MRGRECGVVSMIRDIFGGDRRGRAGIIETRRVQMSSWSGCRNRKPWRREAACKLTCACACIHTFKALFKKKLLARWYVPGEKTDAATSLLSQRESIGCVWQQRRSP
eukprot:3598505-Pleurochrysis_carterae.AAC.2